MRERIQFDPERRRFLKLTGFTVASLFLEGCRRAVPRVLTSKATAIPEDWYLSKKLEARTIRAVEREFCLSLPLDGIFTQGFWEHHQAIDIGAPEGTPVLAAADGRVVFAKTVSEKTERYLAFKGKIKRVAGLGKYVVIDHGGELVTIYGHLKNFAAEENEEVLAGDKIGEVGMAGLTTGPHLHFEVIKDGENVDPMLYLDVSCDK